MTGNTPTKVIAGDTAQWEKSLPDYPASAGWVLVYTLINAAAKITITAAADGDDYVVTQPSATTAAWAKGKYKYQARVTLAGVSHTVETGDMEVAANFATETTLDGRSHARKVLDAVEAVLEGRATKDQEEYTIGDRSLKRTPIEKLYELRQRYKAEVSREETRSSGKPSRRRTLIRMA